MKFKKISDYLYLVYDWNDELDYIVFVERKFGKLQLHIEEVRDDSGGLWDTKKEFLE